MMFNFNQMGLNNPMIGMNNQQNQMNGMIMDGTAQNIRNIIQPYENKIRELEEIIKQKDFEIIVLKQKLNNSNISNINNINPMMINMNMNPFNIIGNMNQQKDNKGKEICLKIISENKSELISCFRADKASVLNEKNNLNEGTLIFNYKPIDYDKTIAANGIFDGSLIYVAHIIINIEFRHENGITNIIPLSEDCPIRIALIYYYISLGLMNFIMMEGFDKDILFLYNASQLKIEDKTPIKQIFNGTNPLVRVKLLNNLFNI